MGKETFDGVRLFVIQECLDGTECRDHITRSEREGHADATITTARGVVLDTEIRDDARLIVDDTTLAAAPWERVRNADSADVRRLAGRKYVLRTDVMYVR